jgi:hypothetical protein
MARNFLSPDSFGSADDAERGYATVSDAVGLP